MVVLSADKYKVTYLIMKYIFDFIHKASKPTSLFVQITFKKNIEHYLLETYISFVTLCSR
ncbi:hypothetical protein SAMN05216556_104117 [Aequorivita viscosa]|uniref:Uncharacterized protein n=1 Tax=Aequorivita viscosa TaxID=797419 RepID=A0A1M6B6W8_9FLAO|nr:hypothetical protein SAMN05216556_104117 [Aequorivita viscosa]SHI44223.1 hypothetical protein SAMN04487908_102114 [Aequorivita viscosa]